MRCARQYFLTRIAKAPQRPSLWLAGGSAVHLATEQYDAMAAEGIRDFDVESAWHMHFDQELSELCAKEPDLNQWRSAPSEPVEVWRQQGLAFVQSWIDWRKRSPWEIWTTPEGEPAIELDVSGFLPGCPVEIKGFVDRVFYDSVFDRLVDVDLKTGKRPPKNADQFATYTALMEVKYDVHVPLGVPFMNRKSTLGKPFDLSEATPEAIGAVYGEAWEQIQESLRTGRWPANTNECFICDVKDACTAQNGPLAHLYDPDLVVPFSERDEIQTRSDVVRRDHILGGRPDGRRASRQGSRDASVCRHPCGG